MKYQVWYRWLQGKVCCTYRAMGMLDERVLTKAVDMLVYMR
jgi:hypothetical protein